MYAGLVFMEHARDVCFGQAFFGGFVAYFYEMLRHRVTGCFAAQWMVLTDQNGHLKREGTH